MKKICVICGIDFKTSHVKEQCCCVDCSNELKRRKNIKKLEDKLGIDSLKDFLYDLYINQMKTTREIALIIYGNKQNYGTINSYLKYFEIPIRHGSKAIKSQWIGEKAVKRGMNPNLTDEDRVRTRNFYEIDEWRKQVFERDNYTCQHCGDNKGHNLVAHHKDGYNWCEERRTDVDNGETLCNKCHKEFHSIYGYGNNTEQQYKEWNEEV